MNARHRYRYDINWMVAMGHVIIRNLDDAILMRLRARATTHGQSLEQELRDILAEAARKTDDIQAELAAIRKLTPPGPRQLSEDLVREGRDER